MSALSCAYDGSHRIEDIELGVAPWRAKLTKALTYSGDTHTLEDIQAGVERGAFQEWSAGESVIITELRDTPNARFIHFFLAAGDLRELQPLAVLALQWGREQGATRASFIGRFGWERSFAQELGFEKKGTYQECDL